MCPLGRPYELCTTIQIEEAHGLQAVWTLDRNEPHPCTDANPLYPHVLPTRPLQEDAVRTIVRLDEAVALGSVIPFDRPADFVKPPPHTRGSVKASLPHRPRRRFL